MIRQSIFRHIFSHNPLEGAFRFHFVTHDPFLVAVLDRGQVRHDVPDRDGAVGGGAGPPAVGHDGVLADGDFQALRHEHMLRLGVERKFFGRSRRKKDATPPGLGHPKVAGLQDPEGALVPHPDEGTEAELQDHVFLEAGEVPDVLQDEITRPVIVAILFK